MNEGAGSLKGVEYRPVRGDLFVDGINPDDINQGPIGNCYLIAAMNATAATNPELIRDMITDNNDGTFTVKFHDVGIFTSKEKSITIDNELPVNKYGAMAYGKPNDHTEHGVELWTGVIEKGFAKLDQTAMPWLFELFVDTDGGYETAALGGFTDKIMEIVTGNHYSTARDYSFNDTDHMFTTMKDALDNKHPITNAFTESSEAHLNTKNGTLVRGHAYAVLKLEENALGERIITLRNPWGQYEPSNDGKNDGIFTMSFEDYAKYARRIALPSEYIPTPTHGENDEWM